MYCKNCGSKINDNQKFCPKCGTAVENSNNITTKTATNKIFIIKTIVISGLIVIIVACIIGAIHNNNPSKQLQGTWQLSSNSYNADFDNYPECEYMTFLEDGTGYFDNDMSETFSYHIDNNTIIMDSNDWMFAYTYNFKISGKELSISYINDEPIFYNKIEQSDIVTTEDDSGSGTYAPMKTVEGEPRWS